MIHLGQSIDLRVVAEGVETEAQFEFLKVAGCDLIQGFLLGKPMSAQLMHQHLVQQRTLAA
jgi:EAL domain-containing protein (putative c-di-GMP-specific phosphodiesterase class I)